MENTRPECTMPQPWFPDALGQTREKCIQVTKPSYNHRGVSEQTFSLLRSRSWALSPYVGQYLSIAVFTHATAYPQSCETTWPDRRRVSLETVDQPRASAA